MINSFLLIGQSNIAGRGNIGDLPPIVNGQVLMFRDGDWIQAKEPVHQDKPFAGEGFSLTFGDILAKKYGKAIGLIPCAMGGSRLDEWAVGEPLYRNAVDTARAALQSSQLKGILWHQGESDCCEKSLAESYSRRFMAILTFLAADLGLEELGQIPVIIGGLGDYLRGREDSQYLDTVNDALRRIGNMGKGFSFVPATGLKEKGDGLHFDTASLREFGKRYAMAWEACAMESGVTLE